MIVEKCEELLRCYFVQLAEGCNRFVCLEPNCARCPQFTCQFFDPDAVALEALRLTHDHPKVSHLCPGLDPLKVFPELNTHVTAFDTAMNALIRGVQPPSTSPILHVFNDLRVFTGILKSNDMIITETNLRLSNESISDAIVAVSKHPSLFCRARLQFTQLISELVTEPCVDTFHHLRSLLLVFVFGVFFVQSSLDSVFIPLIKHIAKLPDRAHEILEANILPKLPALIKHMNSLIQTGTRFWIQRSSDHPERLRCDPFGYYIAVVVDLLSRSWSRVCERDPNVDFTNEAFSLLLDPQLERKWFLENQASILKVPSILTLEFRLSVYQSVLPELEAPTFVTVRRDHLLEDAMASLMSLDFASMRQRLMIRFDGEKGVDEGGVKREFFQLLINQLFSPDYGMFELINNKFYWFKVPLVSSDTLEMYNAVGIIISLAIYNNIILPVRFPLLLYKKLLNKKITLDDLSEMEPEVVRSLKAIEAMGRNRESIIDLGIFFSTTVDNFGVLQEVDLIQGGRHIPVDNDNYKIYISTYLDWYVNASVERQFMEFQNGFYKLCQRDLLPIFSPEQVDVLVSGEEVYDWGSLKDSCRYTRYTASAKQIRWFWKLFDSMTQEDKCKWLRFVTGSDRAPCGGLAEVQIVIERGEDPSKWPVSHSCFNIFVLPAYNSEETLRRCVMGAIQYNEGFELV